jgi:hypothetical protein
MTHPDPTSPAEAFYLFSFRYVLGGLPFKSGEKVCLLKEKREIRGFLHSHVSLLQLLCVLVESLETISTSFLH